MRLGEWVRGHEEAKDTWEFMTGSSEDRGHRRHKIWAEVIEMERG